MTPFKYRLSLDPPITVTPPSFSSVLSLVLSHQPHYHTSSFYFDSLHYPYCHTSFTCWTDRWGAVPALQSHKLPSVRSWRDCKKQATPIVPKKLQNLQQNQLTEYFQVKHTFSQLIDRNWPGEKLGCNWHLCWPCVMSAREAGTLVHRQSKHLSHLPTPMMKVTKKQHRWSPFLSRYWILFLITWSCSHSSRLKDNFGKLRLSQKGNSPQLISCVRYETGSKPQFLITLHFHPQFCYSIWFQRKTWEGQSSLWLILHIFNLT